MKGDECKMKDVYVFISDLHIGGFTDWKALIYTVYKVKEILNVIKAKQRFLVVLGDIVEGAKIHEYQNLVFHPSQQPKYASMILQWIYDEIEVDKIILVPGNHDLRKHEGKDMITLVADNLRGMSIPYETKNEGDVIEIGGKRVILRHEIGKSSGGYAGGSTPKLVNNALIYLREYKADMLICGHYHVYDIRPEIILLPSFQWDSDPKYWYRGAVIITDDWGIFPIITRNMSDFNDKGTLDDLEDWLHEIKKRYDPENNGKILTYRNEINEFIKTMCVVDEKLKEEKRKLYRAYVKWMRANNKEPLGRTEFYRFLRKQFVESKIHGGYYFRGLALISSLNNFSIDEFIRTVCMIDEKAKVERKRLYEIYAEWMKRNGKEPLGKEHFYDTIRNQFKEVYDKRKGRYYFEGLTIKREFDNLSLVPKPSHVIDEKMAEEIVNEFIKDMCIINEKMKAKRTELYEAFVEWAKRNNKELVGRNSFYDIIRNQFYETKTDTYYFEGLALKENAFKEEEKELKVSEEKVPIPEVWNSIPIVRQYMIDEFIRTTCIINEEMKVERRKLYDAYVEWAEENDRKHKKPLGRTLFYNIIRMLFEQKSIKGRLYFKGLMLKESTPEEELISNNKSLQHVKEKLKQMGYANVRIQKVHTYPSIKNQDLITIETNEGKTILTAKNNDKQNTT